MSRKAIKGEARNMNAIASSVISSLALPSQLSSFINAGSDLVCFIVDGLR